MPTLDELRTERARIDADIAAMETAERDAKRDKLTEALAPFGVDISDLCGMLQCIGHDDITDAERIATSTFLSQLS